MAVPPCADNPDSASNITLHARLPETHFALAVGLHYRDDPGRQGSFHRPLLLGRCQDRLRRIRARRFALLRPLSGKSRWSKVSGFTGQSCERSGVVRKVDLLQSASLPPLAAAVTDRYSICGRLLLAPGIQLCARVLNVCDPSRSSESAASTSCDLINAMDKGLPIAIVRFRDFNDGSLVRPTFESALPLADYFLGVSHVR